MAYFDRPNAWQQGSCAHDSRLITAIRRTTGPSLSLSLGKE